MAADRPEAEMERLRALWNGHAQHDPLWAVLSAADKRDRGWDLRDFMKLGEREIALAVHHCEELGLALSTGKALDFGCGVGRLTQALARRFDMAIGVDISDRMIALANALNRYPDRAQYVHLDAAGLASFGSGEFDFVYSAIVLQHIPPKAAVAYVRDFMRLLKSGGIAVFQLPSHQVEIFKIFAKPLPPDGYRAQIELLTVLPAHFTAGERLRLLMKVTNTSGVNWIQQDVGSLRVGNHWLHDAGELMVAQDDARSAMPKEFASGSSFYADFVVTAPTRPGRYVLELDVVHEGLSWFGDRGSTTSRHQVTVVAGIEDAPPDRPLRELTVPEYAAADLSLRPMETVGAPPDEFPMYGVSKAEVLATIRSGGGRLIEAQDDPLAGHDWESYRYFVEKK